jgi:catechol 2,3-dioxygenase-like lactoylglutathione lyase family enzyme|tara:strand:+ start:1937 stop:2365 length:429 start_codon:yes stop_codon:yes gene_type:complete
MIKFEHINIVVKDIEASIHFYQSAFPHWFIRDKGNDKWSNKERNWLHLGDDYQYIAMSEFPKSGNEATNRDLSSDQLGLAHFAFSIDNMEQVMKRLAENGYQPAKDGGDNPFRENIYYYDPSGFEVEFVEYSSDIPSERNST